MARTSKLSTLIVAVLLCVRCGDSTAGDFPVAAAGSDHTEIYETFLSHWVGKDLKPIYVSRVANAPAPEDIKTYAACVGEDASKARLQTTSMSPGDLGNTIRNLSYVRLVDPATWHPKDPESSMSRGQSVDSAVNAGVAHGLMTLSAITFNARHDTAWFSYSFACGRLCGTGAVAIFKRTSKGWARSERRCGGWMS